MSPSFFLLAKFVLFKDFSILNASISSAPHLNFNLYPSACPRSSSKSPMIYISLNPKKNFQPSLFSDTVSIACQLSFQLTQFQLLCFISHHCLRSDCFCALRSKIIFINLARSFLIYNYLLMNTCQLSHFNKSV